MADTPLPGRRFSLIVLIYGAGLILSRALAFLLLPLLTNTLTPAEFGVYALLQSLYLILTVLLLHGMDEAVLRFSGGANPSGRAFGSALFAVLLLGALFMGGLMVFLRRVPSFTCLTLPDALLFGAWLAADALSYVAATGHRAREKPLPVSAALLLSALLQIAFVVLFVFKGKEGLHGLIKSNALSGLITLLFWVPFLVRAPLRKPSVPVWREMAAFGWPLMTAALFYMLTNNLDRWLVNHFLGESATGLYGVAFRVGMGALLLVNAFKMGWYPRLYGRIESEGHEAGVRLARRTLDRFLPLLGTAALFIALFTPAIARIRISGFPLIGEAYWPAFPVVALVALAFFFDGAVTLFDAFLYYERRVKAVFLCTAAGLGVDIGLNLILIPKIGLLGSAAALLCAHAAILLLVNGCNRRLLSLRLPTARTWIQICYFTGMILFSRMVAETPGRILLFGIHGAALAAYFLLLRHEPDRS